MDDHCHLPSPPLQSAAAAAESLDQTSLPANDRVAILLCTYNGAEFLKEQLDSFVDQTHLNWTIYASDDGSTDDTLKILKKYQRNLGKDRIAVFEGPRRGFSRNFMSLIKRSEITADYFCFSDQDDIWFNNKLARSLTALRGVNNTLPAAYCSRTRLVNAKKQLLGFSPCFARAPSFRNSLVQSIAGANTMMINNTARRLLAETDDCADIVAHDWLTYLLVTGCGGSVFYDPDPTLDYRQHSANIIGASTGFLQRVLRLRKMLRGRFRVWSDQNLAILISQKSRLTTENQLTLDYFAQARNSFFLKRLCLMRKAGVYRQTLRGNISLMIATGLNKI